MERSSKMEMKEGGISPALKVTPTHSGVTFLTLLHLGTGGHSLPTNLRTGLTE